MQCNLGDWVVCNTNNDTIEGKVTKINKKTFWVRLQIAGKFKFVKRQIHQLVEVIDF